MEQPLTSKEAPAPKDVLVSFIIRSDTLNPASISDELEIQPAWAFAKGEEYKSKYIDPNKQEIEPQRYKRPWGIWAIDSSTVTDTREVEKHFEYLLSILRSRKKHVEEYLRNEAYSICFYVTWESHDKLGGYSISSRVLKEAADLCHYIDFGALFLEQDVKS
jgi:hypothetical protein